MVRNDDLLAQRHFISLNDLKNRRLICFDREKSPFGWLIARAHEDAGLDYAPFMTVPYKYLGSASDGAARGCDLVDSLLIEAQRFDGLTRLLVTPEIQITICLMTVRSRPLSRLASRFVESAETVAMVD